MKFTAAFPLNWWKLLSFGSCQTALFEEGHAPEEDIVEFFPHFRIVFFFYDLVERFADVRIEILQRTGVLGFDNGCACISTVDDDDIWSPVADFVIRLHIITTADEEANENGMIEVFMVVIMKTDAVQKDLGKLLVKRSPSPAQKASSSSSRGVAFMVSVNQVRTDLMKILRISLLGMTRRVLSPKSSS